MAKRKTYKRQSGLESIPKPHRRRVEKNITNLQKKLKNRRIELGLTQEMLAEKLGVTDVTIRSFENGYRGISLPLLFNWAFKLKMNLDTNEK